MLKSITLRAFPPEMDTLSRVQLARDAGFDGVEINLEPAEEYSLEASEGELRELRRRVETLGMRFSSAYCREQWKYPITSQFPAKRARAKEIVTQLSRAASVLGAEAILVLPGAVDNSLFCDEPELVPYDTAYETARTLLGQLAREVAQKDGVLLAVENVWNKFLLSPLEFAHFIDEIGHEQVGVYFDVGNVLRTGIPEDWIRILNSRIRRVHFKDFRHAADNINGFVTLLEGDVNWPGVREALDMIGYDSWVTAEVLPAYRYHGEQLIYETGRKMDAILQDNAATTPDGLHKS